jgi:hypothetical protein
MVKVITTTITYTTTCEIDVTITENGYDYIVHTSTVSVLTTVCPTTISETVPPQFVLLPTHSLEPDYNAPSVVDYDVDDDDDDEDEDEVSYAPPIAPSLEDNYLPPNSYVPPAPVPPAPVLPAPLPPAPVQPAPVSSNPLPPVPAPPAPAPYNRTSIVPAPQPSLSQFTGAAAAPANVHASIMLGAALIAFYLVV